MAFGTIQFTIDNNHSGDPALFSINNGPVLSETPANSSPGVGQFLFINNTTSFQQAAINLASAINLDYGASGVISQNPIVATAEGNVCTVTFTAYGNSFQDLTDPDPSWCTVSVTAETPPNVTISDVAYLEAINNNPNTHIRGLAVLSDGVPLYTILTPEYRENLQGNDLYFEYERDDAATLSIIDSTPTNDQFALSTFDIWSITSVTVTGTSPEAVVEITANRTFTGATSTNLEYSINNSDWQTSNTFENVTQDGTAYIRDEYGLFLQQDFVVPEEPSLPPSGGYYRYKTNATQDTTVTLNINGVPTASKTIKVIDHCPDGKILKYLNSKGQYRFYPFNRFYEVSDAPELIGKTNKFITNILTDQSDKRNIGYRNERRMILTAEPTADDLVLLADLWSSPRVYLYIGDGASDTAKDWLEVEIQGDGIVRRAKAIGGVTTVTVILPKHYTVTML